MAYNPYNPDEYLRNPVTYPGATTLPGGTSALSTGGGASSGGGVTGSAAMTGEVPGGGRDRRDPGEVCPPGEVKRNGECVPDPGPTEPKPSDNCPDGQTAVILAGGRMECKPKCPAGYDHDENGNCFANPLGGSTSAPAPYNPPPAPKAPPKSQYDDQLSQMIMEYLTSIMQGKGLPFSADAVNKLKAAAFQASRGQENAQRAQLKGDLARAGLSRSGAGLDLNTAIGQGASAQYSKDVRTIGVTAVQENFKAKQQALQDAQQFLNSERANQLSGAQLTLAYAQLNQQWKSLLASFDQQMKVLQFGQQSDIEKMILCLQQGGTNCY